MEDQKEEDGPFCKHCGYCLVGLGVGECPECGRWFDPGMKETVAGEKRKGWVWEGYAAFLLVLGQVYFISRIGHKGPVYPSALEEFWRLVPAIVLVAFGLVLGVSGVRKEGFFQKWAAWMGLGGGLLNLLTIL